MAVMASLMQAATHAGREACVGCTPVMATLIGVDVGTSGTRALAVTTEGRLVAEATRPHELLTPRPGWTEQDPAEWWDACRAALAEVAAAARRRRRAGPRRPDARVGVPRRRRRGDPPGAAVERPAHGRAVRRDHRAGRRRAAARAGRQPGADRLPGSEDPVAARRGAGRVRARGERAAAEGLRALHAHRRARDRRLGRLGHAAARRARARLVGRDPRRPRDPARVAAGGVRGAVGDRHAARRGGRRAGAPARAAGGGRRRRQRGGGGRRRRRARGVGLDLDRHQRRAVRAPRRLHPRPLGPSPRVLPRGARRVAPDGGHAVGGRLAELVARAVRRRLPGAGRRGRRGGSGGRGALVPAVPDRRAQPAPGSACPRGVRRVSPCATGART